VQPDEGITVRFGAKVPGTAMDPGLAQNCMSSTRSRPALTIGSASASLSASCAVWVQ